LSISAERGGKPEEFYHEAPTPRREVHDDFAPEPTNWILIFQSLFSKQVWQSVQVLLKGAILAVGPRTIAAILRIMGRGEERQFTRFHRVLNRANWSPLMASRRLLTAMISVFAPSGPLVMALDDTIERRRGAKIAAKGIYRDPVQSTSTHVVKTSGLRWLCLTLVVPIPWARRHWALPFCCVLAPSEGFYTQRGRAPSACRPGTSAAVDGQALAARSAHRGGCRQ
jgi:hypothetical protein